jgi:hypothetical protein
MNKKRRQAELFVSLSGAGGIGIILILALYSIFYVGLNSYSPNYSPLLITD